MFEGLVLHFNNAILVVSNEIFSWERLIQKFRILTGGWFNKRGFRAGTVLGVGLLYSFPAL